MNARASVLFLIGVLATLLITSTSFADTEIQGLILQDTRWTLDKSPYIVTGSIAVGEDITLTIEPGVRVEFKPDTGLRIHGTLIARGTQNMPITFTAFQAKSAGSWQSISFSSTSPYTELDNAGNYIQGSILEHTIIEYGGSSTIYKGVVEVNTSNLLVDHCTISHSALVGIYSKEGGLIIRNSVISYGSTYGVHTPKNTVTMIIDSTIAKNDGSGIYCVGGAATITGNVIENNNGVRAYGGGINVSSGTMTITANVIKSNAANRGGGIYVSGSASVIITGNVIENNTASTYGGGIDVSGSASVTITGNLIAGNTGTISGGAVRYGSAKVSDFSDNKILGNISKDHKYESAIFLSYPPERFRNNSIYMNDTKFDIYYYVAKGKDMDAAENYWGTTSEAEIRMRIYDFLFDETKGSVTVVPFLLSSPGDPSTPEGLILKVLGASSVQLTWEANPEPGVGYKLYYDTDSDALYGGKGAQEGNSPIDVGNKTSYTLSGLQNDAIYYMAVTAYYDHNGNESPFSDEVRSNAPPQKPSNIAPADMASVAALNLTLESSVFSDGPGDIHQASQWQITDTPGNYTDPVYDSDADTANLTSLSLALGVLNPGSTYYWRVRYQDNKWEWSEYSTETQLTTASETTVSETTLFTTKMELSPGVHIVSLPLNPETPYTASTLAAALGSTIVIRETEGSFDAYIHDGGIGVDFGIEMGQGYIVNLVEAQDFNITGHAWGTPVAAAPPAAPAPWAFVVAGQVDEPVPAGWQVRVTNLRTEESLITQVSSSGGYTAAFVDMSRQSVVNAGDEVTIQLVNAEGIPMTDLRRYRVSHEQLTRAYLLTRFSAMPEKARLLQNYPNPFNPETWLPFQLSGDSLVTFDIYDLSGHLIRHLDIGYRSAGWHISKDQAAYWDGRNNAGEEVSSGVYFYCLRTGDFSAQRKLAIAK